MKKPYCGRKLSPPSRGSGRTRLTSADRLSATLKPMTGFSVSRDGSDAPEATSAFFNEVKNGRDETTTVPGGYGSYPCIYVADVAGDAYYGFATSLDADERAPWAIGYRDSDESTDINVWVDQNTVLDAETLEPASEPVATLVNALIAVEDDNGEMPAALSSDDGDADESDDDLGELFG